MRFENYGEWFRRHLNRNPPIHAPGHRKLPSNSQLLRCRSARERLRPSIRSWTNGDLHPQHRSPCHELPLYLPSRRRLGGKIIPTSTPMKHSASETVKRSALAATTFFLVFAGLSSGYAALVSGLSVSDKTSSGSALSAAGWNKIVDSVIELDSRTASLSVASGNL